MGRILVVCLNPTFQRTMVFDHFMEGEVNRSKNYRLDVSGKGVNVARVIAELGGDPIHLTHVGGPRKDELLRMLDEDGIDTVWADSHSPIRTCTTIIHKERKTTTELVEEPEAVAKTTDFEIRSLFTDILKDVSTVVISGTRTPGYSKTLYPDFVKEAKEAGKRVVLDVKGTDLLESFPYRIDVAKPNLSEFAATFMPGHVVLEQEDSKELQESVAHHMEQLYATYGTSLMLTRGAHAVWLYDETGFSEIPVERVEAVNTIGCGDAVTAGIAYELDRGKSFAEAVATGLSCGKANAQTLRPGTIR